MSMSREDLKHKKDIPCDKFDVPSFVQESDLKERKKRRISHLIVLKIRVNHSSWKVNIVLKSYSANENS